jgi:hypothetical protein
MSHVPSPEQARAGSSAAPVYIRGVPHPLPADEQLLWEGAPDGSLVARHVFHRMFVLGYFVLVTGWWAVNTVGTVDSADFLSMLAVRTLLGVLVMGIFEFLARAVARTSVYAITSKRVVLKLGVVLPMTINVPLSALRDAGVARFRDGSGQLSLSLLPEQRLAYIALWPHCRVFSVNQPQPLLRGLTNPDEVANVLRDAIVADAGASGVHVARGTELADAPGGGAAVLLPS